jgi:hypothetical protein
MYMYINKGFPPNIEWVSTKGRRRKKARKRGKRRNKVLFQSYSRKSNQKKDAKKSRAA